MTTNLGNQVVVDVASLIARASEVSRLCRAGEADEPLGLRGDDSVARLRRIVEELVTTEASYVAGLSHTLQRFLLPLAHEQFLTR